jgi:hypothetical protein
VGGLAEMAAPARRFWDGVKYGVLGAAEFFRGSGEYIDNCLKKRTH